MKVENLAHQRPASAFARGRWYLDTSLFQVLVTHAVFGDGPGKNAKKEVSRGKIQREIIFLKGTGALNFFRPPSPQGGRKEAVVLIVVKPWL
jgi:hypothetical protein